MSETCNPFAEVEQSPHGCRSARFAASVRALATPAQFLQTHDWLLDNRGDFTDDEAREHLAAIGADPDAVMQRLDARDSLNDLVRDTSASNNASPGMRAPVVYLNGRAFVPLEQDGDLVIDDILEQVETDYRTNPGRYLTPEQRNTIR
jgi:hypothetical protein